MHQQLKRSLFYLILIMVPMTAAATQVSNLTLPLLGGGDFKLSEKKGHPIVLAFGATWVPDAEKRLAALQSLADQFSRRGVEFYWVSLDSAQVENYYYASDEKLREFARQHGLRIPILRDPDLTAYKAFGIESAPTLILIGREGQLFSKYPKFFPGRFGVVEEVTRALNRLVK